MRLIDPVELKLAIAASNIIEDDKTLEQIIDEQPSVEPERNTGYWVKRARYYDKKYPDTQPNLVCPFCNFEIGWWDMNNYCAKCGAKLEERESDPIL